MERIGMLLEQVRRFDDKFLSLIHVGLMNGNKAGWNFFPAVNLVFNSSI